MLKDCNSTCSIITETRWDSPRVTETRRESPRFTGLLLLQRNFNKGCRGGLSCVLFDAKLQQFNCLCVQFEQGIQSERDKQKNKLIKPLFETLTESLKASLKSSLKASLSKRDSQTETPVLAAATD